MYTIPKKRQLEGDTVYSGMRNHSSYSSHEKKLPPGEKEDTIIEEDDIITKYQKQKVKSLSIEMVYAEEEKVKKQFQNEDDGIVTYGAQPQKDATPSSHEEEKIDDIPALPATLNYKVSDKDEIVKKVDEYLKKYQSAQEIPGAAPDKEEDAFAQIASAFSENALKGDFV